MGLGYVLGAYLLEVGSELGTGLALFVYCCPEEGEVKGGDQGKSTLP